MNPTVNALIVRAQAALKSQPPLGGNIGVDFAADGSAFIDGKTNTVIAGSGNEKPDCVISLSLDTLTAIEGGSIWPFIDGEVEISGDRALAEKFGTIIKGAA